MRARELRRVGRCARHRDAASSHIASTGFLEALAAVGTSTHDPGVVVVLAVVLPPALFADLIASALGKGDVPAARTRIRTSRRSGEYARLRQVVLEASTSLRDQLLVGQGRIIVRSPLDGRRVTPGAIASTKPGYADIVSRQSSSSRQPSTAERAVVPRPWR